MKMYVIKLYDENIDEKQLFDFLGYVTKPYSVNKTLYLGFSKIDTYDGVKKYKTRRGAENYIKKLEGMNFGGEALMFNFKFVIKIIEEDEDEVSRTC